MQLTALDTRLAIARLPAEAPVPDWAGVGSEFVSVTRTRSELSIVCPESGVPADTDCKRGWRALVVEGPLDFSLTGILASIARPLADGQIPIFAISTYETDYVLVREHDLEKAIRALTGAGHRVRK